MSGTAGITFDVVDKITIKDTVFVLTGDFDSGDKEEIKKLISVHGGKCTDSVSGKTNYVVVGNQGSIAWSYGEAGGKKIKEAMELKKKGIEVLVIKEEDLMKQIQKTSVHIPEGTTKIDRHAFSGRSSLGSIHIPEGVTEIGERAFAGCISLASVHIPESVIKIGWGTFSGCGSLASVHIPEGVTEIGWYAFEGCRSLCSAHIPEGVTKIGSSTFSRCSSLVSIHLPESVKKIGWSAFSECSSLASIHIPDSVTEIGSGAFYGCSSLVSVHISEGVTEIGEGAFKGCSSLSSIYIPESTMKIGKDAFKDCKSLLITNNDTLKRIWKIRNPDLKEAITINILKNLEKCDEDTVYFIFSHFKKQKNKLLPKLLEVIQTIPMEIIHQQKIITAENYKYCFEQVAKKAEAEAWLLEYRNRYISEESFKKVIPEMNRNPFSITELKKKWKFGTTQSGELVICYYKGEETEVLVPEEIQGKKVVKIEDYAFSPNRSGCLSKYHPFLEGIRHIELTDTITEIGEGAFSGCRSLASVNIPEGVTEIKKETFKECSSLADVQLPEGVTEIGGGDDYASAGAFEGCSSLVSIHIPEGVTALGRSAFKECSSLASVHIPEGLTVIGNLAFLGCSSLTSVHIPEGVTEIGWGAFWNCHSLASVHIPEGLTVIGDLAFSGCSSLTSVHIPDGWKEIGEYVFFNCSSLASIHLPESVTKIGEGAFSGCSSLVSVFYGQQLLNERWNDPKVKSLFRGTGIVKSLFQGTGIMF